MQLQLRLHLAVVHGVSCFDKFNDDKDVEMVRDATANLPGTSTKAYSRRETSTLVNVEPPKKFNLSGGAVESTIKLHMSGGTVESPIKLNMSGGTVESTMKSDTSGCNVVSPIRLNMSVRSFEFSNKSNISEGTVESPNKSDSSEGNVVSPKEFNMSRDNVQPCKRFMSGGSFIEVKKDEFSEF
ncbi:unnamed protein product [Acanthoscelides obtectus]|uniref:Uncharacterized protein n=1 Tax=Acanthoscelides obtectus TaxID=200917 RepID=A0A9P0P3R4_ACAOB|nr:unnamed protein product [Acanthoscelides obtectus]CAK1669698.1 hypothetical protein AOBTE_LOCUS27182 [Acanthoscelides obtectus]